MTAGDVVAKVVDDEWRKLLNRVTKLGALKVKIGIVGSEANNEAAPGITMARLAGVHEYGAAIQRGDVVTLIPERSFIRSTIAANNNYVREIEKLGAAVIDGKRDERQALGLLGAKIAADIKKRIAEGIAPPNAPSTIAAKGSSTPLIDTGRLRNAVTWAVVPIDED